MKMGKKLLPIVIILFILIICSSSAFAAPGISLTEDGIKLGTTDNPEDAASSIQILFLLTILTLAPSILIMMTSFTRIIIVLSFLRNAIGTQQMPPNQVLIGLALFLSFFIMTPVIKEINEKAYQPFSKNQITQQAALDKSSEIIKKFMSKQTRDKDLALFAKMSGIKGQIKQEDVVKLPIQVVTPAFLISELQTAFWIGFLIFIPFLIIDMIVSSTLMSMGMMMLPPVMISLPFKILLFVMVDGWNLIAKTLVEGFRF